MQNSLEDFSKYFQDAIKFFCEFQWLFKHSVTNILTQNCLDSFPDGWLNLLRGLSYEELNKFVNRNLVDENWTIKSLQMFVNKCGTLNKLPQSPILTLPQLPKSFTLKLSEKKQYEIFHMAQEVHRQCIQSDVKMIVDFGSGLGYIDQLLNHLYNYTVIGFESDKNNVKVAQKRQIDLYPESINTVKFIHLKITENSAEEIENLIASISRENLHFDINSSWCIIGLHACADLSVNACKLFTKMHKARILIMVPCCYHKLIISENHEFINFPTSEIFKNILIDNLHNLNTTEIFHRPFLRLACQEPAERWKNMSAESHEKHAFYVLARAVLELFVSTRNITLKKCVSKATRKIECLDFNKYLISTLNRYNFDDNKISVDNKEFIEDIMGFWKDNENRLKDVEIYTGLQYMLQKPAESLVLCDRYCWLMENNCNVEIVAILNSNISPRCYAIVGKKKS